MGVQFKPSRPPGPGEPEKARARVLIVDDEEPVVRSTEMLLNMLGYDAIPLQDARRVQEVAAREHADLILQDLRMKDLDLPALVAALRQDPVTANIPIVFFSAAPEVAQAAAELDATGYLGKPFTAPELDNVLRHSLPPPEPPASRVARAAIQRELSDLFHDYWNELAAIKSFTQVLQHSERLPFVERQAALDLQDVVDRIESKTEQLRTRAARKPVPAAPTQPL